MNKEYLPSKKFISIVLFIFTLIVIFFTAREIISFLKNKKSEVEIAPIKIVTIGEMAQKDSNSNGIPDWEEYLWGLDPYKNGDGNKEFIMAKKRTLSQNETPGSSIDNNNLTENEILSRQFFAAIMSLQQTGSLDADSIKSVAEAIGGNIENKDIPDIYNTSMMNTVSDGTIANNNYRSALTKLINKYIDADIGSELAIIIQGLSNRDPQALYASSNIGISYQSFAKELIKIPTPRSLVSAHLGAANNYAKVGETIIDLSKVLADPIIGMNAILRYNRYSDALAVDLDKISQILQ